MASADVINQFDIPRLSAFLSVPQESFSQFAAAAGGYVAVILTSITIKAKEYDELRADRMRAEVGLEQSVRTAENKVKGMKGQLDSALKENQQLREKLNSAGIQLYLSENQVLANRWDRECTDIPRNGAF